MSSTRGAELLLLTGWSRIDQLRFAPDSRPTDLLPQCRPTCALTHLERRDATGCDRALHAFDDANVDQTFLARRLRVSIVQNAIGKIEQLEK